MVFLISLCIALAISLAVVATRLRKAIAERDAARAAVEHASTHDPLTKLATRALFVRRLDDALAAGATGAVLILDLDRLPLVNDVLGHDAGDEVLVEVADRLRSSVRADDLVARLSGGEFVVLLRTDPDVEIFGIAERLIELIRVTRPSADGEIDIPARAGMVQWDGNSPPASAAELVRDAERAMHAPAVAKTAAPTLSRAPARAAQTTHRSPIRAAG